MYAIPCMHYSNCVFVYTLNKGLSIIFYLGLKSWFSLSEY